jgi:sialate O-acetylesterase
MNRDACRFALVAVVLVLSTGLVCADVRLPAVIGDGMVLQRDIETHIWGWAAAGEEITVRIAGREVSVSADEEGRWKVSLAPMAAGGPHEMTVAGANTITLGNIMVGEVWVCSGQSNMQMAVRSCYDAEKEIAAADYPDIRLFSVGLKTSPTPLEDVAGKWAPCSPETVPGFSATAYFFGRHLHQQLGVPVGLINTSWGGTPAEAWTSGQALEADPEFAPLLARWEQILADYPAAKRKYDEETVPAWEKAAEQAKAEGKEAPRKPNPPADAASPHRPANLYNAMIHPLIDFAIRGAIWYQGESNAGRAYQYRRLFPAMILDWRRRWGQGDFPFLFVQLANYMARKPDPSESAWAELREAQLRTLTFPNTGQAVIIDIGDATDIHPKNKQDVGKRLALWALNETYGRDVPRSGPLYGSLTVEGNRARVHFTDTDGGLKTPDGSAVTGFAIAGEDRKFVWAEAVIEGDTVVVSSSLVPRPIAVRYAWADNPECNLYSGADLPASPFRSDDWRGVTINNK